MSDPSHDNPEAHGKRHKSHGGNHGGGHEEGHEGAPEWLISFADNVVLMMGFFVILLAMNMAKSTVGGGGEKGEHSKSKEQEEAMLDFAIGVREAFNNPVSIDSKNPRDAQLVKRLMQRAGQSETRDPGIKGHQQDVQSLNRGEFYAVSGSVPFPENSSEISGAALPTITEVARKVRGLKLLVEVHGHVSSVEASKGPESAMQLATQRAMTVAKALVAEGVAWWQLSLISSADHHRVVAHPTNRTVDMANSRVEIILTDKVVPDEVPTRYEDGPQASAWSSGAAGSQPPLP